MKPTELAGRLQATAAGMRVASRQAVGAGALVVTNAVRAEIAAKTTGGVLRGVGRSGAKVGAKYDVKGAANPTALVRATGPLHLLERDTKPHAMPKAGRKRRGSYKTPFGPKAAVSHPGTKGKHPFEHGVEAGLPPARAAMAATLTRATAAALRR